MVFACEVRYANLPHMEGTLSEKFNREILLKRNAELHMNSLNARIFDRFC